MFSWFAIRIDDKQEKKDGATSFWKERCLQRGNFAWYLDFLM